MNIDLRSDTVTKPTKGMLQAIIKAPTGEAILPHESYGFIEVYTHAYIPTNVISITELILKLLKKIFVVLVNQIF